MATDLSRCFIPLSGELSVRDRRDDVCRFFIESLTVCFKGSSILPESLLTSWETKFHKRGSETLKSLGYRSFQDFLEQEPIARKSFELSPDGYVINRLAVQRVEGSSVPSALDKNNKCSSMPSKCLLTTWDAQPRRSASYRLRTSGAEPKVTEEMYDSSRDRPNNHSMHLSTSSRDPGPRPQRRDGSPDSSPVHRTHQCSQRHNQSPSQNNISLMDSHKKDHNLVQRSTGTPLHHHKPRHCLSMPWPSFPNMNEMPEVPPTTKTFPHREESIRGTITDAKSPQSRGTETTRAPDSIKKKAAGRVLARSRSPRRVLLPLGETPMHGNTGHDAPTRSVGNEEAICGRRESENQKRSYSRQEPPLSEQREFREHEKTRMTTKAKPLESAKSREHGMDGLHMKTKGYGALEKLCGIGRGTKKCRLNLNLKSVVCPSTEPEDGKVTKQEDIALPNTDERITLKKLPEARSDVKKNVWKAASMNVESAPQGKCGEYIATTQQPRPLSNITGQTSPETRTLKRSSVSNRTTKVVPLSTGETGTPDNINYGSSSGSRALPMPVVASGEDDSDDDNVLEASIVELLTLKDYMPMLLFRTIWENVHSGASLHPQKYGHSDLASLFASVPSVSTVATDEGLRCVLGVHAAPQKSAPDDDGSTLNKHTRRLFAEFGSKRNVPPDDDAFFLTDVSLLRTLHDALLNRRRTSEGKRVDITLPTLMWSFEYTKGRKLCRAQVSSPTGQFDAVLGKFCEERMYFPVEITAQLSCAWKACQLLGVRVPLSTEDIWLITKHEKDETKQIANSRVIPRVAHVVIDDRSFASFLRALHSEQQAVGVATDGENVGIALSSTVFRCQFTRTAQLNSGLRCVLVRALVNIAAKQHSNDNSVAVGGAWKKEVEPMILRQEGRVSDAYQEIIRHHAMNLRPITWIDIDQESTWLNVKARQARLLVLSQVEYQHATK
eukprot:GEMP01008863.1.p1 GENE.GEMP01008863.1~~GEMP01008863.1.p1  ORF type:complete len:951 (+),score=139.94 GEMP01008863.1:81-2933(+)